MSSPVVVFDYNPKRLPPEYLQAIGLAIASASQTENVLSMAVAGCLGINAVYAAALTPHMPIPLKMSVLKSAANFRLTNQAIRAELETILAQVQTALTARNKYAHDAWCRHPDTGQVCRKIHQARTKVDLKLQPTTIDEIKAEAAFIYDAGMALMSFLARHKLLW